jgi:Spy/CpxP family protein refolding chaperone
MSREDDPKANGDDLDRWSKQTQRTIDFILQQQAQFTADMQQMREAQADSDRRWNQRWGSTEESIRALLAISQIHEREINALAEAQAQTDRQMRETDERFKETGERLDALVNTVERVISERRNGGRAAEGEGPEGEGRR